MIPGALLCMSLALYFEARGEPELGQIAVAQVIMNRVEDKRWPDSVCDVVFQKKQFSFYWDGEPETPYDTRAWNKAVTLSEAVLKGGSRPITDAVYYHAVYADPEWPEDAKRMEIGKHVFYWF